MFVFPGDSFTTTMAMDTPAMKKWENVDETTGILGLVAPVIIHFERNFQLILTWNGGFPMVSYIIFIWECPFFNMESSRNSLETPGLVAQYFDERNPAVMKGLETLIKAAKAKGKWGHPGAQGPRGHLGGPSGWAVCRFCSDYQYFQWIGPEFQMHFYHSSSKLPWAYPLVN